MAPWYQPLKSPFFLSGVIINAMLAFFLLWAARSRGPRVWLPIAIAMIGVGTFQAAFGILGVSVPGGATCAHHRRHPPGRVGAR
ncbi:hypothetical protein KCU98_g1724, partial [Aureobasidium melanogenum]